MAESRDMEQQADLRSRVVSLEHSVQSNISRLSELESFQRQSELADAHKEGEWKAMNDKIDHVGKKVDKIAGDLSRIMWLILSGLIMGVVAFLLRGGFSP